MLIGARGLGFVWLLTVALAGACAPPPGAHAPAPKAEFSPGKYITAQSIDLRALLPDPPPEGSPLSRAELELVLALETDASSGARERAVFEEQLTHAVFAEVMG